jgi:CheY-like chemotaxis protein
VEAWRGIPLLVLSASAGSTEAARAVGARAGLRKPVDLEVLREVGERHVQRD